VAKIVPAVNQIEIHPYHPLCPRND